VDGYKTLKAVNRDTLTHLIYLPRILRLVWAASKGYTLAWAILLVVSGLVPASTVYLSRLLVDSLVGVMGTGASWDSARSLLLFGGLMAAALLLTEALNSAIEWVRTAQAELVQDQISEVIHEKSVAVDLAFYESAEFHDRLDRARSDANGRSVALLESGGSLIQNGITLLAMGVLLLPYGVWLPFALLVSTLPALYVVTRFSGRLHQWSWRTTPERRWARYYDLMLTYSDVAAELRIFNLGGHFREAYKTLRRRLRTERLELAKGQGLARVGAGWLALAVSGGAMAWMVWRALLGLVSLGDLVLFYQAFNRGQGLMRSLLNNIGQIYGNSLFIRDLFDFLALEPKVVNPPHPAPAPAFLKQGIRFRGVTFHYPGSDRAALQDCNLIVPAGQTVAIVGANGAGKSTLVKLLCRFYDPEAGCIELDGVDIRALSIDELRRRIAVLFQFPVHYHATASWNIALGDLRAAPNAAEIEAAARSSGAHDLITSLPRGYDTLLGKWFADGTDLSAGEWQRIALARAFVRQAPILILDEPTSFMDSWAEIEWFERWRSLANGCTTIIITHRFTTALRADIIHVMQDGRMVESGSHVELLAMGGLYAQSWTAQMQTRDELPKASSSVPAYADGTEPG
jgi:ATP-binding cassette subfamily B protein